MVRLFFNLHANAGTSEVTQGRNIAREVLSDIDDDDENLINQSTIISNVTVNSVIHNTNQDNTANLISLADVIAELGAMRTSLHTLESDNRSYLEENKLLYERNAALSTRLEEAEQELSRTRPRASYNIQRSGSNYAHNPTRSHSGGRAENFNEVDYEHISLDSVKYRGRWKQSVPIGQSGNPRLCSGSEQTPQDNIIPPIQATTAAQGTLHRQSTRPGTVTYNKEIRSLIKNIELPTFIGNRDSKCAYDLLRSLEMFKSITGCTDDTLLHAVILYVLKEDASNWFETECLIEKLGIWSDFVLRFRRKYQSYDYYEATRRELDLRS
ncbi:unnamed protein product [Orchesella dallaii]|uniref:Uncharacterized protein n=1 Tax=Orchesella dallaii TaxID=48710 RepID=A0ABP1R1M9_9HEXA